MKGESELVSEEKADNEEEKIIIADDSTINMNLMKNYLKDLKVYENCYFCNNGEEALVRAKRII